MDYKTELSNLVELSKNFIALLRDAGLILLVIFMILYPSQFKSFLTEAGIQKAFGLEFDLDSFDKLETAQVLISNLQEQKDDLVKKLKDVESQISDAKLISEIQEISKENIEQKEKTKLVQDDVYKILENNTPLVTKKLSQIESSVLIKNSVYTVGLQTVGIDDSERENINQKLEAQGYNLDEITYSYSSENRPSWFALQSTVFYYSASAKASADKLAKFLSSVTGRSFTVQRGAGLGVDPDRKDTTLFAHYIKS